MFFLYFFSLYWDHFSLCLFIHLSLCYTFCVILLQPVTHVFSAVLTCFIFCHCYYKGCLPMMLGMQSLQVGSMVSMAAMATSQLGQGTHHIHRGQSQISALEALWSHCRHYRVRRAWPVILTQTLFRLQVGNNSLKM